MFLSCLVFRAGCGIRFYEFLTISFTSTLICNSPMSKLDKKKTCQSINMPFKPTSLGFINS